jgi:hypothetical protein
MIELSLQTFGISIEVLFPAPRTFQKELIDIHAQWLTDSVNGFAVPPEQVRLQQTDIVFGYNLSVQLFGGNGHFSLDAQRASLSARNARGRADAELLWQVTDRFLRQFAKENFTVAFAANAFAKADSTTVRDEYVQRYRFDPRIAHPVVDAAADRDTGNLRLRYITRLEEALVAHGRHKNARSVRNTLTRS